MIDTKKEQERDELHRAIWAIADELRGAVDGWDFKNYVLGTMFYRYISENLTNYINAGEQDAGNTDFDYAKMSDDDAEEAREGLVEEKGFFIPPSELFCNVNGRADNDENLNETLERVFNHIEASAKGSTSESSFDGLFADFDVNSNKLGSTVAKRNERLAKLLHGVANMNLGDVKDHDIDAFGDAYEYLMTMYASGAGKSGGEFFTPADVSELLTRLGTVGKTEINKVYDPACGSGSLLLKAEKILGKDAVRNGFYGQEINITTYNLCRINMFLHDVGFDKFDIACEDTLTAPQHWDDEPLDTQSISRPVGCRTRAKRNSKTLPTNGRFSRTPMKLLLTKIPSPVCRSFVKTSADLPEQAKPICSPVLSAVPIVVRNCTTAPARVLKPDKTTSFAPPPASVAKMCAKHILSVRLCWRKEPCSICVWYSFASQTMKMLFVRRWEQKGVRRLRKTLRLRKELYKSLKTVWLNWTSCSSVFMRIWSTGNFPKLVFRCCLMIMSRSRKN